MKIILDAQELIDAMNLLSTSMRTLASVMQEEHPGRRCSGHRGRRPAGQDHPVRRIAPVSCEDAEALRFFSDPGDRGTGADPCAPFPGGADQAFRDALGLFGPGISEPVLIVHGNAAGRAL